MNGACETYKLHLARSVRVRLPDSVNAEKNHATKHQNQQEHKGSENPLDHRIKILTLVREWGLKQQFTREKANPSGKDGDGDGYENNYRKLCEAIDKNRPRVCQPLGVVADG